MPQPSSVIRRSSIALVLLAVAGCHDAAEPLVTVRPPACSGAIPVQIASLEKPEIAWTPACGITNLAVRRAGAPSTEAPLWAFSVPENERVGPKIVYGTAPRGANVWGPQPLVVGESYIVTVEYLLGGDAVSATGSAQFKWWLPD